MTNFTTAEAHKFYMKIRLQTVENLHTFSIVGVFWPLNKLLFEFKFLKKWSCFWPLTVSITWEVKINYAYVIMQGIHWSKLSCGMYDFTAKLSVRPSTTSKTYINKIYFHKIFIGISYDIVVSKRSRQNAGAYYE